jgi:hypothetical protein
MDISNSPISARCDDDTLWVNLADGRTLGVPLAWYPRLLDATPDQRAAVTLSPAGLHWEEIDEDISVAGLLAGRKDMTRPSSRVA